MKIGDYVKIPVDGKQLWGTVSDICPCCGDLHVRPSPPSTIALIVISPDRVLEHLNGRILH